MVETTKAPLGINDDNYSAIDKESDQGELTLHVGNTNWLTDYLASLQSTYSSTPKNIMYLWKVLPNTQGNALNCAYAYAYYSLLGNDSISTFIVSFSELEASGGGNISNDLSHVFKNIDTHLGFETTNNYLTYFGETNWFDIIQSMYSGDFSLRTVYTSDILNTPPSEVIGEFTYYNFSDTSITPLWSTIANCTGMSSGYTTAGKKALKIQIDGNNSNGFSEALMLNEIPENMKYTPYISFGFGVDGQNIPPHSMFEVRLKFGTDGKSVNIVHSIQGNTDEIIYLDMTDYIVNNTVDYIRISIRCLTDNSSSYNFCLYDMKGYSTIYSSSELESLIDAERKKNQDSDMNTDTSVNNLTYMWAIIGITIAVTVLGVALYLTLKKNDEAEHEDIE
jgi:hypothetical protein